MLTRPIIGGVFGHGDYQLATMPCVSKGLHAVRFMVIQLAQGQVLSIAEEKREALAGARQLLRSAAAPPSPEKEWRQPPLWPDLELVVASDSEGASLQRVSRRRREVFERSGGVCFYCRCQLSIHAFQVEHQKPKAIGGTDDPLNLVAACVTCNLAKSDRTAIEFLGQSQNTSPQKENQA